MQHWQLYKLVPKCARAVPSVLFSVTDMNPHLSVCSNFGLPQPVSSADAIVSPTETSTWKWEGETKCACVYVYVYVYVRIHTSEQKTERERDGVTFWIAALVSSCRAGVLNVFTFSEGNALAHSCPPNKQSCMHQWQDKTHLIWTCNSSSCIPNKSGPSGSSLGDSCATQRTQTPCHTPILSWVHFLCHHNTARVYSSQMQEPNLLSVWEAISTNAVGIVASWSYMPYKDKTATAAGGDCDVTVAARWNKQHTYTLPRLNYLSKTSVMRTEPC